MRRAIVSAVILALIFAGDALGAVPAGKYTCHYGTDSTAKLSFTVKNNHVMNFKIGSAPYFCGWSNLYEFQTFIIPLAGITSGKVHRTYVIRNSSGYAIGKDKLTGWFSGSSAHGTVGGSEAGCTFATYSWTAHRTG